MPRQCGARRGPGCESGQEHSAARRGRPISHTSLSSPRPSRTNVTSKSCISAARFQASASAASRPTMPTGHLRAGFFLGREFDAFDAGEQVDRLVRDEVAAYVAGELRSAAAVGIAELCRRRAPSTRRHRVLRRLLRSRRASRALGRPGLRDRHSRQGMRVAACSVQQGGCA